MSSRKASCGCPGALTVIGHMSMFLLAVCVAGLVPIMAPVGCPENYP